MGLSPLQVAEQEQRRRKVGHLYIGRVPKGEIAETLGCSKQTITRDIKWLIAVWNREMVKDPVAQRARTLATMQEQERIAAKRYDETGNMGWWDRWVKAVQAIATFLGIAAPIQMDHHLDEDVRFTIEFETPYAPRTIDASYDVFALEHPSLLDGE